MNKGKIDVTNQQLVTKSSDKLIIDLNYLNADEVISKDKPTVVGRAVKAVLYQLDGTTSEMVMVIPAISFSGEPLEKANYFMREYINSLTVHWINISRFETIMGSVLSDGTFKPICSPINHEVPLNKVYHEGKRGQWLAPVDHPNHPKYQGGGNNA